MSSWVPLSEARQLRARVRELERLLGKKRLEAEILKEALKLTRLKKLCCARTGADRRIPSEGGGTSAASDTNLVEQLKPPRARQGRPRPDDQWLLPMIRAIVAEGRQLWISAGHRV